MKGHVHKVVVGYGVVIDVVIDEFNPRNRRYCRSRKAREQWAYLHVETFLARGRSNKT